MANTSLVKKLGIKPGHKVLILGAPEGYTPGALPEGAALQAGLQTDASGAFDLVQLFVRSAADIMQHAPAALKAVKKGGLFWVTFPKKTGAIKSDLSRDSTHEAVLQTTGWEGVTLIAVDDTWSAMRFRPKADVKSKKGG